MDTASLKYVRKVNNKTYRYICFDVSMRYCFMVLNMINIARIIRFAGVQ